MPGNGPIPGELGGYGLDGVVWSGDQDERRVAGVVVPASPVQEAN
jgi:hypothetical protein